MKNMNPKEWKLIVIISIYSLLIGAVFYCEPNWTARQTWVLIFTGIVIILYTWETKKLRFTAQEQRSLQLRPYILLELKNDQLHVANIGNGHALHITLEKVVVDRKDNIEIRFPEMISILRAGESLQLVARSYKNGNDVGDFFVAHLDPKYAVFELDVILRYENIELKYYTVTQRVSPQKLKVTNILE